MGPLESTILWLVVGVVVLGIAVVRQVNKVAPGSFWKAGVAGGFGKLSGTWKALAVIEILGVLWLSCSVFSILR